MRSAAQGGDQDWEGGREGHVCCQTGPSPEQGWSRSGGLERGAAPEGGAKGGAPLVSLCRQT